METYLDAANLHAGLWLHFEPVDGPSRQALLGGAEAVAAALQIADAIAKMRDHHPYEVAHLFYSGPVALAAFIGHQLNACGNIQIYEHQDPGYLPSFFLTDQFPKQ
jgi:hypothetical protein